MLFSSAALVGTTLFGLMAFCRSVQRLLAAPEHRTIKVHTFPEMALDGEISDDLYHSFDTEGLTAFACSKSSGNANFDFFETKQSTSGLVSFYLGDVSGKGVPASLCQATCVSSLKLASAISIDPIGIVSEVNETLTSRGIDGRYATLLYGTLELSTGKLRLLSAGHPNPIRVSGDDEVEFLECTPCLPMGILPEYNYSMTEYYLRSGDTLLLYSDGIVEARDSNRDFLGDRRLAGLAQRFHSSLPAHMVGEIFQHVQHFSPARKDDQTLLALHYSGLRSGYSTNLLRPEGCVA